MYYYIYIVYIIYIICIIYIIYIICIIYIIYYVYYIYIYIIHCEASPLAEEVRIPAVRALLLCWRPTPLAVPQSERQSSAGGLRP